MSSGFGALSLVPPLLAIVLAIVTRRAVLSLFLGIWSGGVIFTGSLGIGQTFDWIVGSLSDEFHVQILIFTLLLGSGVAFVWRLGGSLAVARYAAERIESQRRAGAMAWGLGLLLFFDDYANTAIVGSAMRDISDELRVSREKLSYIVDSTAAPVATFGISTWTAFQLSMIQEGYDAAGITEAEAGTVFLTFLRSVPFNIYCLLAIVMVAIIVGSRRDYGEMLSAEHRSYRTGDVLREDAQPLQSVHEDLGAPNESRPMLRSFFIPILALVVVAFGGAFWTGYPPEAPLTTGGGVIEVAGNADWASALIWGGFAMVAAGFVLAQVYGLLNLSESVDTLIDGFGIMLTAATILVLAWSIGTVAEELGTGEYVTALAEGIVSPSLLPVVVLLASAFIAFSMGSSWTTMAIVTPVAIPLAWNIGGQSPELLGVVVGTVFSGAIFGDHTSPISDTSVLSSTFTGADLIDHVRTQLYYAGTVFLVAIVLYLLYGYLGIPPFILLPLGVLLLVGLVYAFSEWDAGRKDIAPRAIEASREDVSRE